MRANINNFLNLKIPLDILLRGSGLPDDILVADHRDADLVDHNQLLQVYRNALAYASDPALGLRFGSAFNIGLYGPLGYAMLSSSTDFHAVNLALKYQKIVLGDWVEIGLFVEHGEGVIRARDCLPPGLLRVFYLEQLFTCFQHFNQVMVGQRPRINRVHLDYPAPAYAPLYEEVMGCPVLFSQRHNELFFAADILNQRLPHANIATARACEKVCDRLLETMQDGQSVAHQVRQLLQQQWDSTQDMTGVAIALGCDERTLRRRLSVEGISFRVIKDQVREALALRYLQHSTLSIGEIAARLGFSDAGNFRKAFLRWTGSYPSAYRH